MLVGMGSIGSVVGMYCVDFTTMNGAITGGVIGAIIGGSIGAFIGFFVGRDC
ncbi:hypothetical protein SAMN05444392_101423 [Seinonella peptonophila]|uniref:Glycine zipper n=1 Tax=Seinonella peptonophila TaxID=112248 RepID=A0A1M4TDN5_9BACL|nr:hypothetical protein SAMN05444392_101423 [Seinonella peptonophila]